MRVAFLGLGIMGRAMASNLVKAGHQVTVWNRTPKSVEGARTATTPGEAAEGAEVVWMCVSDTVAVESVMFGEGGLESHIAPGMIVADSSTISPKATRRFAEHVIERGADYVDAPVTGSKVGAEAGTLTFIVGGAEATIARLQPLFEAMGKTVMRMGETGMGQSAKLAMNLQIAMIYQGFAEGITMARKLGVDPAKLVELIQASMVRSGVVDYKAPFVLQHDYTPNFPLKLMLKDLRLAQDAARDAQLKLPGLEMAEAMYAAANDAGQGELDYCSSLKLIEQWAGLE